MIFNKQIETIFNKQKEPNQFVGLTEAWRKAQTAVAKEDPLQREQLAIAKQMVLFMEKDGIKQDLISTILEKIERATVTGTPIQLQ